MHAEEPKSKATQFSSLSLNASDKIVYICQANSAKGKQSVTLSKGYLRIPCTTPATLPYINKSWQQPVRSSHWPNPG